MVPSTVDWRGNGADSPVKYQAAYGSCWVRSPACKEAYAHIAEHNSCMQHEPSTAVAVYCPDCAKHRLRMLHRACRHMQPVCCAWCQGLQCSQLAALLH